MFRKFNRDGPGSQREEAVHSTGGDKGKTFFLGRTVALPQPRSAERDAGHLDHERLGSANEISFRASFAELRGMVCSQYSVAVIVIWGRFRRAGA